MQIHPTTRAALTLALVLATLSGAAHAGQSSKIGVSAVVVHSVRLQIAARPAALAVAALPTSALRASPAQRSGTLARAVAADGGTFYVVGFEVGVDGESAPARLGLHVRGAEGAAAPTLRYHGGRGGAWNRAHFGVAVPSGEQAEIRVAGGAGQGGEVGLFVPRGAAPGEVDVVVTVQADEARL